nr:dTDP-4-dehydrorhamnose 3,5-epimerase [uncultured Psychroserpens sp.]
MKRKNTFIKDCFIVEPNIIEDQRGYFFESFNKKEFDKMTDYQVDFVQDNESLSNKGVLRGLHFQFGKHAQAKLVRVVKGKILDIVVDLRENSPTFKKHFSIEISEENKKQLFVPRGFAHGFLVMEDQTIVSYKCDNFFNKDSERGIRFDDKDLNIDWGVSESQIILSNKDKKSPTLSTYLNEK